FDAPPFMTEDRFEPGIPYIPFWRVATSRVCRWTIDLEKGRATSEYLVDRPVALPMIDERFWGRSYEWGFYVAGEPVGDGMRMNSFLRRNVLTGKEDVYTVEHRRPVGVYESAFIPRCPDSPEGDGYLITPVAYFTEGRSDFLIFDAGDLAGGPLARIEMPFLIGWTPHGHWMDFR